MPKKIPLILRFIRVAFRVCSFLLPSLATKWAIKLFLTPQNAPYTNRGLKLLEKVEKFEIEANGKKMVAYKMGAGPEVICLHGWAGKSTQFASIADALVEAGYTFISVDVWAHGKSKGKMASTFDFAAAIKELLARCRNPQAVIGHSLGAASISLAVQDGLQIPKFIAMGAPTIGNDILDSFRAIIHAPSYINQGIKDACLKMYGREFDELTMTHTIKSVKCPILAIHGEDDFDVRIFHLDVLIKAKPEIETLRVKGLGHRRILKDKKTIDRIIEFIAVN